jgi:phosphopantothenoylcysteine decarboxylase/phosphopantothenate--cysteine ligase
LAARELRESSFKPLSGKHVVLGICGGISAYKSVEVLRGLQKLGADVTPVLTKKACDFIGLQTLNALSKGKARLEYSYPDDPIPHTRLGQSADLVVVAPATARLIGAYANGISSDLLTSVLISTRAPVMICPAMHEEMWLNPFVSKNVETLKDLGVTVIGPENGELAGGDVGWGRLADPKLIVDYSERIIRRKTSCWNLKKVLISAGGTREPVDPVRFLGNRSSGKQGLALAFEAWARGADVTLVSASNLKPGGQIETVSVNTAEEMLEAMLNHNDRADVIIMAAAVADFRPKTTSEQKIKRTSGLDEIVLEPTPDVLKALVSKRKNEKQLIVGFAAEDGDPVTAAAKKLKDKGVDFLVVNDVSLPKVGFDHDTNQVSILSKDGKVINTELVDKRDVAYQILNVLEQYLED